MWFIVSSRKFANDKQRKSNLLLVFTHHQPPRGAQLKPCLHFEKVAIGKICQPLRAMAASSSKGDVTSVSRQRNANGSIGVEEGAGDAT
jgi:hypothetical protein